MCPLGSARSGEQPGEARARVGRAPHQFDVSVCGGLGAPFRLVLGRARALLWLPSPATHPDLRVEWSYSELWSRALAAAERLATLGAIPPPGAEPPTLSPLQRACSIASHVRMNAALRCASMLAGR